MDETPGIRVRRSRRELLALSVRAGALGVAGGTSWPRLHAAEGESSTAATEYGEVRGVSSGRVISFRGIPYGGSASSERRFLPPAKPTPWKGIREAVRAGPRAVQSPTDKGIWSHPLIGPYFGGGRADAVAITAQEASEDCLVLNVLTQGVRGKRPVMVYIHGGGFVGGSGALTLLGDRFVAEEDIVLVGINHRLNAFGYTYLGDLDPRYADSGNVGQLDLIAALQWVQANISSFGGDPRNVTIFGESGGGAKICALLAMPGARGLFHRAIIESGSFLSARTREEATEETKRMLSSLGVSTTKIADLQNVPAERLFDAYTKTSRGLGGPVVDGRSLAHPTWAPGAPPESADVSMIVGTCKDEGTLFSVENTALFALDWNGLRAKIVQNGIPEGVVDSIIASYRKDYPKETASDIYFRIGPDRGVRRSAITQSEMKVAQKSGNVYMYLFAWNTPTDNGRLRAWHTSELPLVMRLVLHPEAESLSKQLAGAWAAFARTGDPNDKGLPEWKPYSIASRPTMIFDVPQTSLVNAPDERELSLLKPYPSRFF